MYTKVFVTGVMQVSDWYNEDWNIVLAVGLCMLYATILWTECPDKVTRTMDAILISGAVVNNINIADAYGVIVRMMFAVQFCSKILIGENKNVSTTMTAIFWTCVYRMQETWQPAADLYVFPFFLFQDLVLTSSAHTNSSIKIHARYILLVHLLHVCASTDK